MRKNSIVLGLILGIVLFASGVLSGCGGEKKDAVAPVQSPAQPAVKEETIQALFAKAKLCM